MGKNYPNYRPVMDCVASLESYLPSLVFQHLVNELHINKESDSDHLLSAQEDLFDAVCLVCDVSRLVKKLDSDGTIVKKRAIGLEEEKHFLIECIKICFGQFMKIVSDKGGDVFKLSSDTMIALWPPPSILFGEEDGAGDEGGYTLMERSARSAALCAFSMLEELVSCNLVAANEAAPPLKIGIGVGKVSILHLGGVLGCMEYVAVGDALVQAFNALHYAKPGCVATSERLGGVVCEQFVSLEGGYVALNKLRDCSQAEECILQPYIGHSGYNNVRLEKLDERLKQYIPETVLFHHDNNFNLAEGEFWCDELRTVSILYASLSIGDHHDLSAGIFCDKSMMVVHNAMVTAAQESILYNGSISKIVMDDKRCTLIAVYGLPGPPSCANGPVHAILGALKLCEKLCGLKLIGSFGIATGEAFCGLVGSKIRSEHTIYGAAVNCADALMQVSLSKGGGILCDENTLDACRGVLDFIPKGKCETEWNNQMNLNMLQPYPSEFSSISAHDLFSSNIFKSIFAQQMSKFVLFEALAGPKMHPNLSNRESLCSSVPCTTALRDVSSLEKPNEGMVAGNVPIVLERGNEIFHAWVINGLKSWYVVVCPPPIAENCDEENWKMEYFASFVRESSPCQICNADGNPPRILGDSSDNVWGTMFDNLNMNISSTDDPEKKEDENRSCAHTLKSKPSSLTFERTDSTWSEEEIQQPQSLLTDETMDVLKRGTILSTDDDFLIPDSTKVDDCLFHRMSSQCGLIPIPYVLNSKTLENLSMASMLHTLKNLSSVLHQGGVSTSQELSDSASLNELGEAEHGVSSEKCMTELLQVLSHKMNLLSGDNSMLLPEFGKPVNEWSCSIAVPVGGDIGKLDTSSPRMLLPCDCAKTTTGLIKVAHRLAKWKGFLGTSSRNSDKLCLNIQGTRTIFTNFDPMPMDIKLLPSVLRELCTGHVNGRSKESSRSSSCVVQPLSQCGVIELVLAKTDSTIGIQSHRVRAQLVLLQMKASLALNHKGGIVLIEGAHGVGKSHLLSRFAGERTFLNVTTLYFTASTPFGYREPYGQWGALLAHLLDVSVQTCSAPTSHGFFDELVGEKDVQERTTTSYTAREQALLNELKGCPSLVEHAYLVNDILGTAIPLPKNEQGESKVPVTNVEVVKQWQLDILLRLLCAISQRLNPVLIIDDAQYFAEESWEVALQSMSLGPNGGPISALFVFAFRPLSMLKGLFPRMSCLASKILLVSRKAVFLKVEGLPPEDVEHLLIDQLSTAAPVTSIGADLRMAVEEFCLGNPFIIKEFLGDLKMSTSPGLSYLEVENEEGVQEMVATLSNVSGPLPLTLPTRVTGLMLNILHHVSSQQLLILKTASVLGREFSFRLLFEIYPIKEHLPRLLDEVNAIVRIGLLVCIANPPPCCNGSFSEPRKVLWLTYNLMRGVLQSMMPLSQRRHLENQLRSVTELEKATMHERVEALKLYPVEQDLSYIGKLNVLSPNVTKQTSSSNGGSSYSKIFKFLEKSNKRDWKLRTCFLARNCLYVSSLHRGRCVLVLHLSGSSVVEKVEEHNAPSWQDPFISIKHAFYVKTLDWNVGGVEHQGEEQKFYFFADNKELCLKWICRISYAIIHSVEHSDNEFLYERVRKGMRRHRFRTWYKQMFSSGSSVQRGSESSDMSRRTSRGNTAGLLMVLVKRVVGDFLVRGIPGTPAPYCELILNDVLKKTSWGICSLHNPLSERVSFVDGLRGDFEARKDSGSRMYDEFTTKEWVEEVSFEINVEQLKTSLLFVHVFNKNIYLSDDYLGSSILPLSNFLQEGCPDKVPIVLHVGTGYGKLEIECHLKMDAEILQNARVEKNIYIWFPSPLLNSDRVNSSGYGQIDLKMSGKLESGDILSLNVSNSIKSTYHKQKKSNLESVLRAKRIYFTDSERDSFKSFDSEFLEMNSTDTVNFKWRMETIHPLKDRIFVLDDPWVAAQDRYLLKGWEFDIFSLGPEEVTLFIATLFAQSRLPELFSISPTIFMNFLYVVQEMMTHQSLARYHTYRHVADVMHATWIILYNRGANLVDKWKCPWAPTGLTAIGDITVLISSLCHDLDHPGLNNDFLINSESNLGKFYGDKSPLENHHIAVTWSIIRRPGCNIFVNFTPQEVEKVQHCMHRAILQTDMTCHYNNENAVINMMATIADPLNAPLGSLSTDMMCNCCAIILHAADISSAGRVWDVCRHWVELLYQEFDEQAKIEKEAKLPVTVMQGAVYAHQPEFIDFIFPYFEVVNKMIPNVMSPWLAMASQNKKSWAEIRNAKKKRKESLDE